MRIKWKKLGLDTEADICIMKNEHLQVLFFFFFKPEMKTLFEDFLLNLFHFKLENIEIFKEKFDHKQLITRQKVPEVVKSGYFLFFFIILQYCLATH